MSRPAWRLRPRARCGHRGRTTARRPSMTKYLLLKHYRGAPEAVNDVPMDQWTPEEVEDHLQYMADFAARLERAVSTSTAKRSRPRARSSGTAARGPTPAPRCPRRA